MAKFDEGFRVLWLAGCGEGLRRREGEVCTEWRQQQPAHVNALVGPASALTDCGCNKAGWTPDWTMVFLREGGKDELSLLLESHRHRPGGGSSAASGRRRASDWAPARTAAAQGGSSTAKGKGKERATDAQDQEGTAEDAIAATSPSKRKRLAEMEPTDSLLHRLAGPSTGKAGLKRE